MAFSIGYNRAWCKGCMICFNVCPRKVFGVEKEVDKDGYRKIMVERAGDCSGCMLCAFLCPDIALEVKKC